MIMHQLKCTKRQKDYRTSIAVGIQSELCHNAQPMRRVWWGFFPLLSTVHCENPACNLDKIYSTESDVIPKCWSIPILSSVVLCLVRACNFNDDNAQSDAQWAHSQQRRDLTFLFPILAKCHCAVPSTLLTPTNSGEDPLQVSGLFPLALMAKQKMSQGRICLEPLPETSSSHLCFCWFVAITSFFVRPPSAMG